VIAAAIGYAGLQETNRRAWTVATARTSGTKQAIWRSKECKNNGMFLAIAAGRQGGSCLINPE
jgi:hypothetical protein